jgi:chromate transporter
MGTLWHLLVSFGQIGVFALGGGSGMLKLIEEECVDNRGWLRAEEFTSLVGATFLFPALAAVKLAALIGLKVAGCPGSSWLSQLSICRACC